MSVGSKSSGYRSSVLTVFALTVGAHAAQVLTQLDALARKKGIPPHYKFEYPVDRLVLSGELTEAFL